MIVKYADTIDTESLPAASGLNAVDIFQVTQSSEPKQSALSLIRDWITSNATGLAVASGTITASAPVTITQTWNSGAVTFKGLDINVTDTASNAASLLADFRVGGTSVASISKLGSMTAKYLATTSASDAGVYLLSNTGAVYFGVGSDCRIQRDAAAQLAIRNTTTAQSLAIYTTESSSLTNYERLRIYGTAASAFTIASEAAGTGTVRSLDFKVGATTILSIDTFGATTSGNFTASSGGSFRWPAKSGIYSPSDGVIRIANNAGTDFNRLQFGLTTSAAPAIKRSGTILQARLADDSLFTGIDSRSYSIYETYTDASNYERLRIYGTAASAFTIASEAAGTGTARDIAISTGGTARVVISGTSNTVTLQNNSTLNLGGSGVLLVTNVKNSANDLTYFNLGSSTGVVTFAVGATNPRFCFTGTTSASPAIKRSGTILQARLADDTAFATYQGKIQTDANAVSEAIVPTHTLTLYDAAGTAYKVAVQAA